jgi:hypothetical protein
MDTLSHTPTDIKTQNIAHSYVVTVDVYSTDVRQMPYVYYVNVNISGDSVRLAYVRPCACAFL